MNKFKKIQTILFAGLIAAMILPFAMSDLAVAEETTKQKVTNPEKTIEVNWGESRPGTVPAFQNSSTIGTSTCEHYASMSNKCFGWDNLESNFYYTTPNTYLTPDFCEEYTCADTDHYQWAPAQISEGGYAYTFKSAQFNACAHNEGVCTSPTYWSDPYGTWIGHNNIPTDDPITAYTIYTYERAGGETITRTFINYLIAGYS